MNVSPRVFISDSHDSPGFMEAVLTLANSLRQDGINASIDRYVPAPLQGWPRWMEEEITAADFVLLLLRNLPSTGFQGSCYGGRTWRPLGIKYRLSTAV